MKFSEKIIQARKAKALTQEDLAEAVGVSRQAVSKWETEEAKPDLDKLVAICSVLDLSMDYLCLDKQPEVTVELPPVLKTQACSLPNHRRVHWPGGSYVGWLAGYGPDRKGPGTDAS